MDNDIELGRFAAHGTIAGGAHALRAIVEADATLSRTEKDSRQAVISFAQGILHATTEFAAAVAQARRS